MFAVDTKQNHASLHASPICLTTEFLRTLHFRTSHLISPDHFMSKNPALVQFNPGYSKVYVCLFTCASTRAVHLELTRGMNVQDFLLAFLKLASRRGLPATIQSIQSDNAKTFKSSSKEIRKIARSPEVWKYLANHQITWNFIVEKAPWWSGYWERLLRSFKSPIKKVIGRSALRYDEMSTLLTEVEAVINARPLPYVYDDQE